MKRWPLKHWPLKHWPMKRWPWILTTMLVVMWLLLNGSLDLGHWLLGGVLAMSFILASTRLRPLFPKVRRLHEAVPFIARVLIDILRSNVAVGRIVLGLVRDRQVHSGFLQVPLEMRDPHGLAILAAVLTATPGTAWAGMSEDRSTLTLHILDLKDEAEWIRTIKHRYERPLMRIFE